MSITRLLVTAMLTSGLAATAGAQVDIHSQPFDAPSGNWSMIGTPTAMALSSFNHVASDGNPGGFTELVAGPLAGPDFVGFRYEVSGLDFGVGPVTVSFDGRIPSLTAAATHVRINGNFFGAIMGSFNDTSWTNWSESFELAQGFDATSTLTIDFEFGLGAVDPTGGVWEIDNILVSTTPVPEPAAYAALTALLALGLVLARRRRSA